MSYQSAAVEELPPNILSFSNTTSNLIAMLSSSYAFSALKYILIGYFIFSLVMAYLNRGKVKPRFGTNHRDRLSKRFYESQYDFLRDMDQEEASLMDVTFENTVKNATTFPPIPQLGEDSKGKKTSSKKVSFQEETKEK